MGREETIREYIGLKIPVIFHYGNRTIRGVPIRYDAESYELRFNPSIVSDKGLMNLEETAPTTILLSDQDLPITIRPLKKGDLQRIVNNHNFADFDDD